MHFAENRRPDWVGYLLILSLLLPACSASAFAVNPTRSVESATPAPPPFTLVPLTTLVAEDAREPTPTGGDGRLSTPTLNAPTPTPTGVQLTAPSALPNCAETKGTVAAQRFNAPTLQRRLWMRVYLPPCYETHTWRAYPVLYLIHGLNMNENAWDDLGADETADTLIAGGEIPPLIIVMPRAPEDERYTEAVVTDLVPYVDRTYRTLADREHRALGGMSRGGGWSVRIGFQHPEAFGALGLHSLAIFYADEDQVWRWLNRLPEAQVPRIYMDIGQADSGDESSGWLDEALTQRGIPHEFHHYPGGHDTRYWKQHLAEYLRWYAADW
jgi:enterochelin esterase-like enzyme